MEQKELLTVPLEMLITKYAQSQFSMNGIGAAQARLVMKSVYCNFLEDYVEADTLQRTVINGAESSQTETRTGTMEDLKKTLSKAGGATDGEKLADDGGGN